ncbi:universal stress protein [Streptomyces sp. NPDC001286]
MNLQHVVVGVDGTLVAVRALDRAADEAARRDAELRVVYAVPDRDEAPPILASAVARVHARRPGMRVTAEVVQGNAVRELTDASEGAALTVVGTRGFGGVTGTLFGSVSLRLAAQVHGPLMVVRGDHPVDHAAEPFDAGRHVLLGLQGDGDADVAAYAFEEAERRGVWLHVLHSWNHRHVAPELPSLIPATSPGQQRLAQHDRAEEAVPRFSLARLQERHPQVGVDARTVRGGPAHALLEATADASVVVIGAHRRTGRVGPHLGTVAHTLLHHSHCPVVLVPADA